MACPDEFHISKLAILLSFTSSVRSMSHFLSSPQRAWRWLLCFFGLLFVSVSVLVLLDWPTDTPAKDKVMLVFPFFIFLGGSWLFVVGAFSEEERLERIVKVMQKLGGYS